MDEDYISDDEIGSGSITIRALISLLSPQDPRETWITLTFKSKVSAEILLRASLTPFVSGIKAAGIINK
jgi:hypothetical protein